MSQEFAETFLASVLENIGGYLLEQGMKEGGAFGFESRCSGGLITFSVKDENGAVVVQVAGEDADEVGAQLALACLHRMSIDQLRALHKQPVRKPLVLCKKSCT